MRKLTSRSGHAELRRLGRHSRRPTSSVCKMPVVASRKTTQYAGTMAEDLVGAVTPVIEHVQLLTTADQPAASSALGASFKVGVTDMPSCMGSLRPDQADCKIEGPVAVDGGGSSGWGSSVPDASLPFEESLSVVPGSSVDGATTIR